MVLLIKADFDERNDKTFNYIRKQFASCRLTMKKKKKKRSETLECRKECQKSLGQIM